MRRAMLGIVVALGAMLGPVGVASAQIVLPGPPFPLPLPPFPSLPGIPGLTGVIFGNGQQFASTSSPTRALALTLADDPVEDVRFPIVISYARPQAETAPPIQRLVVTAKPLVDGATCGPSGARDSGQALLDVATPGDFTRNILNGVGLPEPGRYQFCGYLQDTSESEQADLVVRNEATVREPNASVSLGSPDAVGIGDSVPISVSSTAEIERVVVVTARPRADGPAECGATADQERRYGSDVLGGAVPASRPDDPQTLRVDLPPRVVPGPQLLCAYVGEGTSDPEPEERASRTFEAVGPTACQVGQAALRTTSATAEQVLANATLRGQYLANARTRLTAAQRKLTATTGKRARRTQAGRVRGAQELVVEQSGLLATASASNQAAQATLAAQRTATARLCS